MTTSLRFFPNPARKDFYESLVPKALLIAVEANTIHVSLLADEIIELDNSITEVGERTSEAGDFREDISDCQEAIVELHKELMDVLIEIRTFIPSEIGFFIQDLRLIEASSKLDIFNYNPIKPFSRLNLAL